ncbi:hypothetical protein [Polymorphospora rubra]|uniref:Uncharacterized protein n=1 Tax=Polymorphospora rubra TaxID=338584 RepID=A0A810MZN4_9ACTN|nr:hypothetical protein [Polymorphospora rubra]BCJ65904.1 hypothetical protein Prubr_29250 [Polymorphospora rubra]
MGTDKPVDTGVDHPTDDATVVLNPVDVEEPPAAAGGRSGGRHRAAPSPRDRDRRRRTLLIATVASVVALGATAVLVPMAFARLGGDPDSSGRPAPSGSQTPGPSPSPQPSGLVPGPVQTIVDGRFSWALLDRSTGVLTGSSNVSDTVEGAGMMRIWVVADYLRHATEQGGQPEPYRLAQASRAIRDGDDDATQALYEAAGGATQSRRMIPVCALVETEVHDGGWRRTRISAGDSVRLGDCVADGRAAGPKWTKWVLDEMAEVNGEASDKGELTGIGWGIVDGLPPAVTDLGVGFTNGFVRADSQWQVNCLAATDGWVLAVLVSYPDSRKLSYGAGICASVAAELAPPQPVN